MDTDSPRCLPLCPEHIITNIIQLFGTEEQRYVARGQTFQYLVYYPSLGIV